MFIILNLSYIFNKDNITDFLLASYGSSKEVQVYVFSILKYPSDSSRNTDLK